MKNWTLLATKFGLNGFTQALKDHCIKNGPTLVKVRNGDWVEIQFRQANEDCDLDRFVTDEPYRRWYMNGQSVTSRDYDLIECNVLDQLTKGG